MVLFLLKHTFGLFPQYAWIRTSLSVQPTSHYFLLWKVLLYFLRPLCSHTFIHVPSHLAHTYVVLVTHARDCPRPLHAKAKKTSFRFLVSLVNSWLQVQAEEVVSPPWAPRTWISNSAPSPLSSSHWLRVPELQAGHSQTVHNKCSGRSE